MNEYKVQIKNILLRMSINHEIVKDTNNELEILYYNYFNVKIKHVNNKVEMYINDKFLFNKRVKTAMLIIKTFHPFNNVFILYENNRAYYVSSSNLKYPNYKKATMYLNFQGIIANKEQIKKYSKRLNYFYSFKGTLVNLEKKMSACLIDFNKEKNTNFELNPFLQSSFFMKLDQHYIDLHIKETTTIDYIKPDLIINDENIEVKFKLKDRKNHKHNGYTSPLVYILTFFIFIFIGPFYIKFLPYGKPKLVIEQKLLDEYFTKCLSIKE